jgi:hypothetical protein
MAMKSRITWCLIGINIALLTMFLFPRIKPNTAVAQRAERPADYILIPGTVLGLDRGIVYVIDSSNGQMSALAYDDASGRLGVMPPTDLLRVFEAAQDAGAGARRRK